MSYTLGEVEYDKNEYLNFGAQDYKEIGQNLKTEINIIDTKKEINENNTDTDLEELEHIENM